MIRFLEPSFYRSCKSCEQYLWDDDPKSSRFGLPMIAGGEYQTGYDPPTHTPCEACPKVSRAAKDRGIKDNVKLTSADALEPDSMHFEVVEQIVKCEAIKWNLGRPVDPWLFEFAADVLEVKDQADRQPHDELLGMLRLYLARKGVVQ